MNKSEFSSIKNNVLSSKPSTSIRLLLMVLFVSITPLISFGQSQTFNASGSFTVPPGVTSVTVQAWGAGGAGGGSTSAAIFAARGGAGGGGGAYATATIAVTPGATLPIVVGAGGTVASGGNGNAGGFSTITGYTGSIYAAGGSGGAANTAGGAPAGGAGGTTIGSVGITKTAGAAGVNGATATSPSVASSGAGGAGANSGGAGGVGIGTSGTTSAGNPGFQPGGGGGGARTSQSGGSQTGGIGGAGRIIISWCPTDAGTLSGNQYICTYNTTTTTFASTVLGGTWSSGSPSVATVNSSTGVVTAVSAGTALITYTVGPSGCTTRTTTRVVYVANTQAPSLGQISYNGIPYPNTPSPALNFCRGTTSLTFSITGIPGVSGYVWKGDPSWTINPAADGLSATVTFSPTANSNNIEVYASNGCSATGTQSYIWLTLGSGVPASVNIAASPSGAICSGTSVTFTATPTNGGTTPSYQWKLNGTNVGTNSATYTNSGLANGNTVTCVMTSNATSCVTGSPATSNTITATVIATPSAPTIGTITQPNCSTSTGSVVLNGLPSGNWMLTRAPGNVTTTGTGTSTTISGLAAGTTYTYTVDTANNGTGLKGEYYSNINLTGTPILTRNDATVGFDWGNGSPNASIGNDGFSVRWTGFVQPLLSETYTFYTRSDDGIRLWVNGIQIINNWTNHAATINTGTIALTAGVKYSIVLEYYENTGQAVSQLLWSSPANPTSVIIPTTQLFPVGSCASPASANIVINAQPVIPSTPTIGTTTQPDCVNGGSVVLSGLPASGTINQTGTVITNYVITGTTMTISGLAAGSYNFAASNGSCSSSATGNVEIIAPTTATWTGSAWINGPPTASQALEFSGDYNSTGDLTACSCKVTGSKNVVINSGHNLIITNEVTVIGTGTLTFENNASLVQINNVANSGEIIYKRNITSPLITDYTYWSSPVDSQDLDLSIFYKSGMYYSYDDFAIAEDWKEETAETIMKIGKGYIVRGPQTMVPPGIYFATFKGVPNNGPQSIKVAGGGKSSLIGNPYPSAIDADAFLTANSTAIDGTLYFWTHNTALQDRNNFLDPATGTTTAGSGALAYTSNDYAVYNLTGGVVIEGVTYVKGGTAAPSGGVKPTGQIAAAQSFFTTSTATGGDVNFTNAMRVDGSGKALNNSNFFKTKNSKEKTTNAIEKNRVWLNLTNKKGAFKQTLVGYVTNATNDYDSRFDGESFDGNEFVDFYSINQDKNLTIQGRALPFDEKDEVPLGFKSTIAGDFTINIDQIDGLFTNQAVFIEDKLTNTVFDLKSGGYTFNTIAGTFNDRFVLKYTSKTLGTNNLETSTKKVLVFIKNKQISINSFDETINKVSLYDVSGRLIYFKDKVNSNELSISNFVSNHQVLIVKTTLQNGKTVIDKIVY